MDTTPTAKSQLRQREEDLRNRAEAAWKTYAMAESELKPLTDRLNALRHEWCELFSRANVLQEMLKEMEADTQTESPKPEATV